MKKKSLTITTTLALISTFCALLTMLINVSNKITSIKEKAEEEQYDEYQMVTEERAEVIYEDANRMIIEYPDGEEIEVDLDVTDLA